MEIRKGILVHVLRSADGIDCTNGGVSSKHDKFVLIDNPTQRIGCHVFTPSEDSPPLYLAQWHSRIIALPADLYSSRFGGGYGRASNIASLGGWMFGGNFVYTSDSRYHELTDYPIPVYDRKE